MNCLPMPVWLISMDRQMLDQSLHYEARTFAHHWFENQGNGNFRKHRLPNQAQFSSINAIEIFDYNQDAYPDLLIAGNLYQAEVETPRADASLGLVLIGTETSEFEVIPPVESGLMLHGEVREIRPIRMAHGQSGFLFGRNDQTLALWTLSQTIAVP